MSPASKGSARNPVKPTMSDMPSFGTTADWVAEPAGGTGGERAGGDAHPFDPRRYWDIYAGTD